MRQASCFVQSQEERAMMKLQKLSPFNGYLEIQPTGNNEFMLREEDSPYKTREDLEALNKKLFSLASFTINLSAQHAMCIF